MKNLYEAATVEDVKQRIARLGPYSPRDEWATLMYQHLDHHLRQFGV